MKHLDNKQADEAILVLRTAAYSRTRGWKQEDYDKNWDFLMAISEAIGHIESLKMPPLQYQVTQNLLSFKQQAEK